MGSRSDRLEQAGWDVGDAAVLDEEQGHLELTSGEQLRVLTDAFRLRLLTSLGRQPGSAKELAERFDVPTTRLYHHLGLLEEHGFVRVVATRQSGARTERCYGVPRWASIRPARAMVEAADTTELGAGLRAMAEVVGVTLEEAVRAGELAVPTDGAEEGPHVVTWSTARLTVEQQLAFSAELADLVGRVAAASQANAEQEDAGAESMALYVVLAPDVLLR